MYQAIRSNVVINIQETDVEKYLNLGYNITDMSGKVLFEAIPNDTNSLKRAFVRHTAQIKQQAVQIAQLQALVKELQSKPVAETVTEKPKRTHKTTTVSE